MYLSDVLGGMRRRWWVALIGVIVTAFLGFAAVTLVPLEQTVRASVLVLPPAASVQTGGNPFLALGGLQPAADVLANSMNDGTIHQSLAPSTGKAKFDVSRDTSSSGPLLLVQVTDVDPSHALLLMSQVLAAMPTEFQRLQDLVAVPKGSRLTLSVVTQDVTSSASAKSQTRALLIAIAGGLALTVFGTNFLDGLLLRGEAKRLARPKGPSRVASSLGGPPGTAAAESGSQPALDRAVGHGEPVRPGDLDVPPKPPAHERAARGQGPNVVPAPATARR